MAVPIARKFGARVIGMTGRSDSTLANLSDCVLDIGRVEEACPLKLAPTASTSAMLALGDALAMVVLAERDFGLEDYAGPRQPTNLELVEEAVALCREVGRPVASGAEAAELIGLPGPAGGGAAR